MAIPREYKQSVVVPLPTDTEIRAVVGDSYDPDQGPQRHQNDGRDGGHVSRTGRDGEGDLRHANI